MEHVEGTFGGHTSSSSGTVQGRSPSSRRNSAKRRKLDETSECLLAAVNEMSDVVASRQDLYILSRLKDGLIDQRELLSTMEDQETRYLILLDEHENKSNESERLILHLKSALTAIKEKIPEAKARVIEIKKEIIEAEKKIKEEKANKKLNENSAMDDSLMEISDNDDDLDDGARAAIKRLCSEELHFNATSFMDCTER